MAVSPSQGDRERRYAVRGARCCVVRHRRLMWAAALEIEASALIPALQTHLSRATAEKRHESPTVRRVRHAATVQHA